MDDTIEGTDSDAVALLQNHSSDQTPPSETVIMRSLSSAWNNRKTLLRFVSAEVVVFSFVFTFNYYQQYSQQYSLQWYSKQALKNVSYYSSPNKSICYNQTLIDALSGSNQTFDQVERQTAYLNLMITLVNSVPSVIINLLVAPSWKHMVVNQR